MGLLRLLSLFVQSVLAILDFLTLMYLLVLITAFLIRVFGVSDSRGFVKYVFALAEPPLRYLKRYLPPMEVQVEKHGSVDVSAFVIFIILFCFRIVIEFLRRGFQF